MSLSRTYKVIGNELHRFAIQPDGTNIRYPIANCRDTLSAEAAGVDWVENGGSIESLSRKDLLSESALPVTIKGPMSDCWDQVQAVQDRPFVAIWYIGPPSLGDDQVNIDSLLDVIAQHSLDIEHFGGKFWTDNPCEGIVTRNASGQTVYLDGDPMYHADGVVRFHGNFMVRSHVFCLDTNHIDTIARLKQAIQVNIEFQREHGTGTLPGDLEIEAQERATIERWSAGVPVKEGKISPAPKSETLNSTPNLDLFD